MENEIQTNRNTDYKVVGTTFTLKKEKQTVFLFINTWVRL